MGRKSSWHETASACEQLGLSPKQLQVLRKEGLLKPGLHYRVKNPKARDNGRRYLWHVELIEGLLVPEQV